MRWLNVLGIYILKCCYEVFADKGETATGRKKMHINSHFLLLFIVNQISELNL